MMRIATWLSVLVPAVALAGCTLTPAEKARIEQRAETEKADLDKALRGLTSGSPTQCISQYRTQQVRSYGPTIVYTVSPNLKYVSQTSGGCDGVGGQGNNIFVTRTTTGQLCSGDIAQTVDRASGFFTGSCSFGEFTPYRKAR
ncbi:hypothetical protein QE385_002729 [Sphingomonas sp. SORGH_AS 950]|uniref:hypothetical protein n=1 Tax=Sphingomonas sp. SORGH_AS_0950 TaxID=3041792 RepID=UPI0027881C32|nr:hypothetical protein [Sphingomonas sp. SORGH_AS_0950]MDQ1158402.1 hypothetical protein [Sphingomonas sp. SORGH_AS_0950]